MYYCSSIWTKDFHKITLNIKSFVYLKTKFDEQKLVL